MAVLAFIYRNLDQYKRRFFLILAASVVNGATMLTVPLLLAEFTRAGFTYRQFTHLLAALIALIIVSLVTERVIRQRGEALASQFGNHLRRKYFGLLEEQPMSRLTAQHSGYTVALIGNVAGQVQGILLNVFWSYPSMVMSLGFFLYFTIRQAWWLAALDLAILGVFLVTSMALARRMTALATELNERSALFFQYFADFLGNVLTVKRLGIRQFAAATLGEKEQAASAQVQRLQNFHGNRWMTLHGIFYTASYTTIGLLLYEISQRRLPVSVLIVFIAILNGMRAAVERLSENILTFAETKAYVRDLEALVTAEPDHDPGTGHPGDWDAIIVRDVTFSHPGSAHAIAIPELTVRRGEKVCITGASGQGKTTTLALLAGFLDPERGQRHIAGVRYADVSPGFFRDHVAYISQDVELFSISVWDNLALGGRPSRDDVRALLDDMDLSTWLGSLSDGWDTLVGEKGVTLSAGQRQRVNLARGILLNKDVYLLDEPTSALDAATEARVVAALSKRLSGKTVIIVTHRDAIRSICDREYEMRDYTLHPLEVPVVPAEA